MVSCRMLRRCFSRSRARRSAAMLRVRSDSSPLSAWVTVILPLPRRRSPALPLGAAGALTGAFGAPAPPERPCGGHDRPRPRRRGRQPEPACRPWFRRRRERAPGRDPCGGRRRRNARPEPRRRLSPGRGRRGEPDASRPRLPCAWLPLPDACAPPLRRSRAPRPEYASVPRSRAGAGLRRQVRARARSSTTGGSSITTAWASSASI